MRAIINITIVGCFISMLLVILYPTYYVYVTHLVFGPLFTLCYFSHNLLHERFNYWNVLLFLLMLTSIIFYYIGLPGSILGQFAAMAIGSILPSITKYLSKKGLTLFYFFVIFNFLVLIVGIKFIIFQNYQYVASNDNTSYFMVASLNYVSGLFLMISLIEVSLFSEILNSKILHKKEKLKKIGFSSLITTLFITIIIATICQSRAAFGASIFITANILFKNSKLTFILLTFLFATFLSILYDLLNAYFYLDSYGLTAMFVDLTRLNEILDFIYYSIKEGPILWKYNEYASYSSLINSVFSILPLSIILLIPIFSKIYYRNIATQNSIHLYVASLFSLLQPDFTCLISLYYLAFNSDQKYPDNTNKKAK